ncbi:MAG TPA: Tm-1-like ATP-binding domain-containing protein [Syntrophorhabdales bacterium]|nr:Tm-1-like ATP-binding domain-containing protein [Syntrophorhabdales bacterium]
MKPPLLLLATMDTKGLEALYLRDRLGDLGAKPLLMDLSMKHGDPSVTCDVPCGEVAEAGGSTLEAVAGSKDMTTNMEIMTSGAASIARRLVDEGRVMGVIALGGCTGTLMITEVFQGLPFGLPKVMVSSAAAQPGLSTQFMRTSDIMLFHSVVEISGLSAPVRNVLDRAACAVVAMVKGPVVQPFFDKERAIAMTMMSPCEMTARSVRLALEREGFQVIGFHANGIGDRAFEEMVASGLFHGVIDLAPGAVGEHLYGYMRDAGSLRLESAGRMAIPQVISTCGVNHATPSKSRTPAKLWTGRKYDLDRFRTWLRVSIDELRQISEAFAEKLNGSKGPVKVLVPLKGWSSVDSPGSPTYDPDEDALFVAGLKNMLKKEIEVIEVDANMETPEFARAVIGTSLEMFRR